MITLRVIALKDEPNQALLSQLARYSCRLFKTHDSGPFFLDVPSGREGQDPEFGDFHGVFAHDPDKIDFSFLDTFKSKHQNRLRDVTLHKDIITDAVYLSSIFQTRVLSGYSNDEGDDWAVVAENGRLLRLRFRAEPEVTGDVSPERLRKSKTEIHATRVLPEPNEADSDNAYEYTVCEAIKTEDAELSFQPFWRFIEGEIGAQVVFETLWQSPAEVAPSLIGRGIELEFTAAFGEKAPNFLGDHSEFEFIQTLNPERPAAEPSQKVGGLSNVTASIFSHFIVRHKVFLGAMALLIAVLVMGNVQFSERELKKPNSPDFQFYCEEVGGFFKDKLRGSRTAPAQPAHCILSGVTYAAHSLPGQTNERRQIPLIVEPYTELCHSDPTASCFVVGGAQFPYKIDGYEHSPGVRAALIVERLQQCNPLLPEDCPDGEDPFVFKKLFEIRSSRD